MEFIRCKACPLRSLPLFTPVSEPELALIESLKKDQVVLEADQAVIHEGQGDSNLYTLLSGWAFRYKTLSDGRRQILNFLLPGDFIGVQQKMSDAASHGVQTLTESILCVFKRDALWEIHRDAPKLGFEITWLTAHEESVIDDTLLSVGRRNAEERIAALLIQLYHRVVALMPETAQSNKGVQFPLTQQHIADGLGLSLVHTNKTLRKLGKRGFHVIEDGRLRILDAKAMAQIADVHGAGDPYPRPLI